MRFIFGEMFVIFIITIMICSTLGHGGHGHSHGGHGHSHGGHDHSHGGDDESHEEHDHSIEDFSPDDDEFEDVHASSDAHVDDDVGDEPDAEDAQPPTKPPRERPIYSPPVARGTNVYFADAFESEEDFKKRWVVSRSKKDTTDEAIAKYDGKWSVEEPTNNPLQFDIGLVLKSRAKHHAIAAKLIRSFDFTGRSFVVQYEVKFQNGQECGGAYIKLLSKTEKFDLAQFNDKTDYTIMFGPDKCGTESKIHFIFRHKNPITGKYEEKHAKQPSANIESFFTDKKTHLYTLVVKSDNVFEIYVDQVLVNSGSLLEDMTPAVNPPKEISDPMDKKPADWDERERIIDPEARKPEDWDETQPEKITDTTAVKPEGWLDNEPELVADPSAEKPSDWDDDMDGEWEAAMITNPKCESGPGCGQWKAPEVNNPAYKGKWTAPMIDNPNYQGKWSARKIANPEYYEDTEPFRMTPISAVGLELWSMSDDILFDNFFISDDKKWAERWAGESWELKREEESYSSTQGGIFQSVIDATNDHPWLWAVIIVVVVLPIVLFVVCCCMSSSKASDDDARRKKTDKPTSDTDPGEHGEGGDDNGDSTEGERVDDEGEDVEEEGEEDEEHSKDVRTEHTERVIKKPTKAALETPVNEAEDKNDSDTSPLHDEKPTKTRKSPRHT